jgi:hypothetical protein
VPNSAPRSTTVSCLRRLKCEQCGCRYTVRHKQSIIAFSREEAEDLVVPYLQGCSPPYVCPSCGAVPARAAAHKRAQACLIVTAVAASLSGMCGAAISESGPNREWLLLGAVATSCFSALLLTLFSRKTVGKGSQAQQDAVATAVAAGGVVVEQESLATPGDVGETPTPRINYLLLGAAWVSSLLILTPLAVRLSNGWPVNSGVKPTIVGPGDTLRVELPDSVQSVDGRWRGKATAVIANARELGVEPSGVQATSSTDVWGLQFNTATSKPMQSGKLWVDLHLPNDQRLTHQPLQLEIVLSVTYPIFAGGNTFDDRNTTFTKTLHLQTATPHAAKRNRDTYIVAGIGIAGIILSGFALLVMWRRIERSLPNGTFEVIRKPPVSES